MASVQGTAEGSPTGSCTRLVLDTLLPTLSVVGRRQNCPLAHVTRGEFKKKFPRRHQDATCPVHEGTKAVCSLQSPEREQLGTTLSPGQGDFQEELGLNSKSLCGEDPLETWKLRGNG